jgi:N-acetylgalactosamine-N,N'-diacetylbacillosaminyl-diphospho-undecaprenol 4-alpha-N-acetylgalactosaminyltransferase
LLKQLGRAGAEFTTDPQPPARHASAFVRRRRLLFVINSLTGGGAERVFTTILHHSRERLAENDVHVALLDRDPPAFTLPAGVTVHQLNCGGRLADSLWRLTQLARRLRPQLILSFLTRANVAAVAAGKVIGCSRVISERNDTGAQLAHGRLPALRRATVRLAYRRADRVIAVADGIRDALAADFGVERRRIMVVNNPVDLTGLRAAAAAEPGFPVSADDVVMLARLEPQKNLGVAIEAFARSGRQGRLIILGEGAQRPYLRSLGERVGLDDRLLLPGYLTNPFSVLARAGAFLLTSRHEGFCNSLVEAMALGVPVLASDCRFSPAEILQAPHSPAEGEVVVGTGGLLVRVDDVAATATGLTMLEDGYLEQQLSRGGRRRAEDFAVAKQVDLYWDAIADPSLIGGSPDRL